MRTTSSLNVEEVLLNVDEVFQVEQPPAVHLDRQQHHEEEQGDADVVARRSHLLVVLLEPSRFTQQHRQNEEVGADKQDSGQLAQEPVARQADVQQLDPEVLG